MVNTLEIPFSTALISSREVLLLPLAQIVQKVKNTIYQAVTKTATLGMGTGTQDLGTWYARTWGLGDLEMQGFWDKGTWGCEKGGTRGLGKQGLEDVINKQHLITMNFQSTSFSVLKNGIICWRVCQQTNC